MRCLLWCIILLLGNNGEGLMSIRQKPTNRLMYILIVFLSSKKKRIGKIKKYFISKSSQSWHPYYQPVTDIENLIITKIHLQWQHLVVLTNISRRKLLSMIQWRKFETRKHFSNWIYNRFCWYKIYYMKSNRLT